METEKQQLPGDNEVHVWWAFNYEASNLSHIGEVLSTEEVIRAASFKYRQDRDLFTFRRYLARVVLSGYLVVAPGDIQYSMNSFGKPELINQPCSRRLTFNISSSGSLVVVSVASHNDVGIDVECIDDRFQTIDIADLYFCPEELSYLYGQPEKLRCREFYRIWVRKEAYLKAMGTGFLRPPDTFCVLPSVVGTNMEAAAVITDGDGSIWTIANFELGPSYLGAVAIHGPLHNLTIKKIDINNKPHF